MVYGSQFVKLSIPKLALGIAIIAFFVNTVHNNTKKSTQNHSAKQTKQLLRNYCSCSFEKC